MSRPATALDRTAPPPRILVSKLGLDGHDRGAKLIALNLRDAGYEVIFLGIRQTPEQVASVALSEDVDLVGISILSGAHSSLVPAVMDALEQIGVQVPVVVGGIIPDDDTEALTAAGIAHIFRPGVSMRDVVSVIDVLTGRQR